VWEWLVGPGGALLGSMVCGLPPCVADAMWGSGAHRGSGPSVGDLDRIEMCTAWYQLYTTHPPAIEVLPCTRVQSFHLTEVESLVSSDASLF